MFKTPPLVLNVIDKARKKGARTLNLSADRLRFHLPVFPLECLDLPELEELDFSGHALAELPPEIVRMAALKVLDVRRNPLRRLPAGELPPLFIDPFSGTTSKPKSATEPSSGFRSSGRTGTAWRTSSPRSGFGAFGNSICPGAIWVKFRPISWS